MLFGPEVDKQSVDGQLVTVFVMLQIVNLVCSKFDQIPKYLQTLGVKSQSYSNFLSLLVGGALLTQLSLFELVITLCIVLQAIRN